MKLSTLSRIITEAIIAEEELTDRKVKNPETGNMIKISTALEYDPSHPAYKAAQQLIKAAKKAQHHNVSGDPNGGAQFSALMGGLRGKGTDLKNALKKSADLSRQAIVSSGMLEQSNDESVKEHLDNNPDAFTLMGNYNQWHTGKSKDLDDNTRGFYSALAKAFPKHPLKAPISVYRTFSAANVEKMIGQKELSMNGFSLFSTNPTTANAGGASDYAARVNLPKGGSALYTGRGADSAHNVVCPVGMHFKVKNIDHKNHTIELDVV